MTPSAIIVGKCRPDRDRRSGSDDAVGAEHAERGVADVHRATLALAIAGGLAHQFGHHLVEVTAFGHQMTVSAVSRRDVVVVVQCSAHASSDGFLSHIEMKKTGKPVGLGQSPGRLLEQTNAHHAPVEVELFLRRDLHVFRAFLSQFARRAHTRDRRRSS